MRVIAIDPGYERVGIAILEQTSRGAQEQCVYSETFQTNKEEDINQRIFLVGQRIQELSTRYKVDNLAIETLFFSKNQKTAMQVAQARGTIIYVAKSLNLGVYEFSPSQIKVAVTGNGQADKKSMIHMTKQLVTIDNQSGFDDEYDAIACGLTFFAHYR